MKKFIFILISSIFIITSVRAQYDPQFSQNMNCLSFYNPAMASLDGKVKATGLYRDQWVGLSDAYGFKNSPQTFVFSIDVPFQLGNAKQAGGILFMSDEVGLFSNQAVYLQYAYHRKFKEGLLSVGVNIGFLNDTFDKEKVKIPESDAHADENTDPKIANLKEEAEGNAFDMSLGVAYNDDDKYLGISLSHLTSPALELGENAATIKIKPLLNITGGYNFLLTNPLYVLKPSLFFKTDFASWQIDIGTVLEYNKTIFGGISYRYQDAIILLVGANLSGVSACVSYDITMSKLGYMKNGSSGSVEFVLSYSFSLERPEKNIYKSVRIL